MIRSTFSTTTIASSTTIPIASTRPNRVRRLIEKPSASMPAKVVTSATTIATAQMSVVRRLCRKRYTTSTTRNTATISVWITSSIDSRTKSFVSSAIAYSIPSGKRLFMSSSVLRTADDTTRPFAPACW